MLLAFDAPLPAVDMLYVSLGNNTIVSYDTTGNNGSTIASSVATFASTNLNSPQGLAFDSLGNLFVGNYGNNTISKFGRTGAYLGNINNNTYYSDGTVGMAIDSHGNLFASNSSDNTIRKFSNSGLQIGEISALNLSGPLGITLDSADNLYVAMGNPYHKPSGGVTRILKFDEFGNQVDFGSRFGSDIGTLGDKALAFNSGYLFATCSNSAVYRYGPFGGYGGTVGFVWNPQGLAFDSSNNMYIASAGDNVRASTFCISKLDSNGIFITSWLVPAIPRFIAFQLVPEPSTYALAAIATGVIAYLARRRKPRTA